MSEANTDELVPIRDAAKRLGLDHRTLRKGLRDAGVKLHRLGNRYRVRWSEVQRWVESCRVSG